MSSPDRVTLYFSTNVPGVTALSESGSEQFPAQTTIAEFLLWIEAAHVPGSDDAPVVIEVSENAPSHLHGLNSPSCQVSMVRYTTVPEVRQRPGSDRIVVLEPETVEEAARQWLNIDAQAALQTLLTHLCVLQAEIAQPLQIALRFDQPIPITE